MIRKEKGGGYPHTLEAGSPKNEKTNLYKCYHKHSAESSEISEGIMAKRKRTVGLVAFLKGNSDPAAGMPGCANYDHYYGGCLFGDTCLVQEGRRCGYFERAVLPTAKDIGLAECVYSQYEKICGASGIGVSIFRDVNIRRCPGCGAELRPRHRYCDRCAQKRRLQAYRQSRQRKAGRCATVN